MNRLTFYFLTLSFLRAESSSLPVVKALRLKPSSIHDERIFGGFVEAVKSKSVTAELQGSIDEVMILPGQRVKRGQSLIRIKPKGQGFDFQPHQIQSPFEGMVTRIHIKAGSPVNIGDLILDIADPQQLRVVFQAAPDDLKILRVGQRVDLLGPHAPTGAIEYIARAPSDQLPIYEASARLSSASTPFEIGSFVRIKVSSNERRAWLVPISALQGQRDSIYIVDEKEPKIKKVSVRILSYQDPHVEIEGGFLENELLVLSANKRLKPGQSVTIESE